MKEKERWKDYRVKETFKNRLQTVEELAKGVSQPIEEAKNKEVKMEVEMRGLVDGGQRL